MNLYLTVSRGRRADEAQPVLAISDHFLANISILLLPPIGEECNAKVVDLPQPLRCRKGYGDE
jgi:hypothetical protein